VDSPSIASYTPCGYLTTRNRSRGQLEGKGAIIVETATRDARLRRARKHVAAEWIQIAPLTCQARVLSLAQTHRNVTSRKMRGAKGEGEREGGREGGREGKEKVAG